MTNADKKRKAAYLEMINAAAQECDDLDLLDLVYKLLAVETTENK